MLNKQANVLIYQYATFYVFLKSFITEQVHTLLNIVYRASVGGLEAIIKATDQIDETSSCISKVSHATPFDMLNIP